MTERKERTAKTLSCQVSVEIAKPSKDVYSWALFTPLEIQLPGTARLPAVTGTETLNGIKPGFTGHRRLVNLADGTSAIEEITHTDNPESEGPLYFEYRVSDYTLPIAQNIETAIGQWWFEQKGSGTSIRWKYSFVLFRNSPLGRLGGLGRFLFSRFFVKTSFREWMVSTLDKLKSDLETNRAQASPSPV